MLFRTKNSVVDQGFPDEVRQPQRSGRQPIIWKSFAENGLKMREIRLRAGRVSLFPHLGSANGMGSGVNWKYKSETVFVKDYFILHSVVVYVLDASQFGVGSPLSRQPDRSRYERNVWKQGMESGEGSDLETIRVRVLLQKVIALRKWIRHHKLPSFE